MSNCQCNKRIDGLSEFVLRGSNAFFNSLAVSGGQNEQILQAINTTSDLVFRAKFSDRMIEAKPGINTFSAAIAKAIALTPTETSPVGIIMYNGIYSETGSTTITIPTFVSVFPLNTALYYTVLLLDNVAFPPATPFITMNAQSSLENMTIVGNNNCDILVQVSGNATQGTFFNGMVLMGVGPTGTVLLIKQNTLFFCGDNTIQTAIFNSVNQHASIMIDVETGAQCFYTTSSVSNFLFSSGITGYRVNGNARFEGVVATIAFMENGLIANDSSVCRLLNTDIQALPSGTATAVTVNNSAEFVAVGCNFRGGWLTHINATTSTSTVNVQSTQLDTDKLILASGSFVNLQYYDSNRNNLGNHILGNQFTGVKAGDTTSLFGEGSISLANLSVQKFQVGVGFTDTTTTIKPDQNTPVILFDAVAADNAFYVGDDNKFSGFSYESTTAVVLGSGAIIWEYWNGATWTQFRVMVNNAVAPYESYTFNLAISLQKQNIRFQNDLLLSTNWATTVVNGITKYWVRYRITTAITTPPAIKNLRLLGDQSKINADGTTELFGRARARKILPFDYNLIQTVPGGGVGNQNVFIAPTIGIARNNNNFTTGDEVSFVFYLPAEIDTSSPVQLLITFFSDGTDVNDFNVEVDYACTSNGDPLYLTSGAAVNPPKFASISSTLTPNINTTSRQVSQRIPLRVDLCRSRNAAGDTEDIISLTFRRVASANPNDLIILNLSLIYLSAFSGYINS